MTAAPVSTMSDVLVGVRALLSAVGDLRDPNTNPGGIELLFGERYLQQEGTPPRIIFVQTEDGGQLGPVLEIGARQVAGVTESVRCYIWGAETADDATRYDDAKARAIRLINAFRATAPGWLTGARLVRGEMSNVETFGEEYQLTVSYTWGVPRDETIYAAALAAAPSPLVSPSDPDRPNGDTGQTFTVVTTNADERD